MSLSASLEIAGSGIDAVNAQLALVSQNVANANTPGYAVETLPQTSLVAGNSSEGVVTGIAVNSINTQLQQDLLTQNAVVGGLAATQAGLQPVDAAQGTVAQGNDLSSLVATLDSAFVTLQSDPSSAVQQSQVVTDASQLAGQINQLGNAYVAARQNAQNSLVGEISQLGTSLNTIGSLTDQIMQARDRGQSSATLESQRSQVLQSISSLVDIKTLDQPNGDLIVLTAGGLTLPIHGGPGLSLANAVVGPNSAYQLGSVPGIMLGGQDVTAALTGGSIGANVTLRDSTLPTYQAELDEFSQNLSTRFAAQGLTLFTGPSGTVPQGGGSPLQSGYVGYALSITVNPAIVATPSLVRDGTDVVQGSPTGASAFTPNTDPTQTGFATLIQRVIDFTFGAQVQNGVTQPQIATAGLGPAGNLAAPYNGVTTLSGAASALVGAQSATSSTAEAALGNEQAVQTTLQTQFASGTAVNTDTELATMIKLQNAYGANAKIISAVQAMWSALLAALP